MRSARIATMPSKAEEHTTGLLSGFRRWTSGLLAFDPACAAGRILRLRGRIVPNLAVEEVAPILLQAPGVPRFSRTPAGRGCAYDTGEKVMSAPGGSLAFHHLFPASKTARDRGL